MTLDKAGYLLLPTGLILLLRSALTATAGPDGQAVCGLSLLALGLLLVTSKEPAKR